MNMDRDMDIECMLPELDFDNSVAPDVAGINSRCMTVLLILFLICCEKKTNYKTS